MSRAALLLLLLGLAALAAAPAAAAARAGDALVLQAEPTPELRAEAAADAKAAAAPPAAVPADGEAAAKEAAGEAKAVADGKHAGEAEEQAAGDGKEEPEALAKDEAEGEQPPAHEGSEGPAVDADVTKTLAHLGTVLNKIFVQVENDEHMFKVFKEKVLEDEVSKSNVDLSWPAIKDLVRSEVQLGRQKIENQVNNFKVEVLDVVQRGLGDLRASLHSTITAGFVAPSEALTRAEQQRAAEAGALPSNGAAAAVAGTEANSVAAAAAAAGAHGVEREVEYGANIDDDAEPARPAAATAANVDDEAGDVLDAADPYAAVASPVDSVSRALAGHLDAKDVLQVRQLVLEKMARHDADQAREAAATAGEAGAAAGSAGKPLHNYGQTAEEALHDLRQELGGRMSEKDLSAELSHKLAALRAAHANASPATAEALRRLEAGVNGAAAAAPAPAAAAAASHPTGDALLDRLQHRLDGLVSRAQRVQLNHEENGALPAAAAPEHPAEHPFVVEAEAVGEHAAIGDGRVTADLKGAGKAPALQEEGVAVEFAAKPHAA